MNSEIEFEFITELVRVNPFRVSYGLGYPSLLKIV